MPHDQFDTYRVIIEDTNKLKSIRRELDSTYVALLTLVLTGDAFAAFYSSFDNWLSVLVTLGIGIFGTAVVRRWSQGLDKLHKILNYRYEFLRNLESTPTLQAMGATIFTTEHKKFYEQRDDDEFKAATLRLHLVFYVIFWVIPVILAILTAVDTISFFHQYAPQFVIQFIHPLSPVSSK